MKVVSIGGGTGLSALLRGLKHHGHERTRPARFKPAISRLTAVVTVTDEGGSSGRLRDEFGILPPGDIRNCLVALAEDEELFTRVFSYRFSNGRGLRGHSLGNLLLTALTHLTRDFARAVQVSSEVLAIRGEIYPSTLADVRLSARLRDGRAIAGESRITKTRVPIERLQIVPSHCRPLPETLAAICEADLITIGPGSLYTSLIPNLLVHGIPETIALSRARKVYICNLMTQPGETSHYTAADHLRALNEHAGSRLFDHIIVNLRPLSPSLKRKYASQRAEPVANDLGKIRAMGVKPILAKLLAEDRVARHDPRKLAKLVLDLVHRQG
ncbi:MAG TPA: gluconeogenesis factor YvcK family protein [Terriglobia bacterium]|nr:gluconeogenesis factor YvcK family protein [Terriglobia bacterium]